MTKPDAIVMCYITWLGFQHGGPKHGERKLDNGRVLKQFRTCLSWSDLNSLFSSFLFSTCLTSVKYMWTGTTWHWLLKMAVKNYQTNAVILLFWFALRIIFNSLLVWYTNIHDVIFPCYAKTSTTVHKVSRDVLYLADFGLISSKLLKIRPEIQVFLNFFFKLIISHPSFFPLSRDSLKGSGFDFCLQREKTHWILVGRVQWYTWHSDIIRFSQILWNCSH